MCHYSRRCAVALLFSGLLLLAAPRLASAAILTVANDDDSGTGSLRDAIVQANAAPDADEIRFNLPGSDPTTITLTTDLPPIVNPVVIDGTTQPGYSGSPQIMLSRGTVLSTAIGIDIGHSDVTIRGLAVSNFGQTGISINGAGTTNCVVEGCTIGMDLTGRLREEHPGETGLLIFQSGGNRIGGDSPGQGNAIVGTGRCVDLTSSSGNVLSGNKLGLSAAGDARIPVIGTNRRTGVAISSGSANNVIRGSIFGGSSNGVTIDSTSTSTTIQGNLIGLAADGLTSIPIVNHGILSNGSGAKIGGDQPGEGNVVAACSFGIRVQNGDGGIIQGNIVGLNADQTAAIPNHWGVYFDGRATLTQVKNFLIGGLTPAAGNVIAGNDIPVTSIGYHSSHLTFQGNLINITREGRVFGSQDNGFNIAGATTDLMIGGIEPGAGNIATACAGRGALIKYLSVDNDEYPRRITLLGNVFYGSIRSGIDLEGNHTQINQSPNDPGDLDDGPNGMQNYPTITEYRRDAAGNHVISGSLDSIPNQSYLVEVYSNKMLNPINLADAERFVARFYVSTGTDGKTSFTATVPFLDASQPGGDFPLDRWLTATATDPAGNTSELSPQFDAAPAGIQSLQIEDIPSTATLTPGGGLKLVWKLSGQTTSDTLKFTLENGGGAVSALAEIPYGANGQPAPGANVHDEGDGWSSISVALPQWVASRDDYRILAESELNPGIADSTATFAIRAAISAAGEWREYP